MKKLLFLLVFIPLVFTCSDSNSYEKDVFICKGPSSKKFHLKSNCRGLSNCSTKIYKVNITEAKRIGRTLCGFED